MPRLNKLELEFTRKDVVQIIKSVIHHKTPDEARQLGAEYLLEKWEEKRRQAEQETPVLSDQKQ